jgi:omega-amidase
MIRDLNLHLFQWRVLPGDIDGNLQKAGQLIAAAGPGPGDLIVLPEMYPCGFFYRALEQMARRSDRVLDWMSETARGYRSGLSGSLPVLTGEGIANRMVFLDERGEILAGYDKIHLFSLMEEDRYFVPGNHVVTLSWSGWRLGLAVCFDLRFPEIFRRLYEEGAELAIVSAQWPLERIGHFKDLVKVRAMENQFFLAACNSCGEDSKGIVLGGESLVAGPSGEIVDVLDKGEGFLSRRISLGDVEETREKFPVVRHRRSDMFGVR